MGIRYDTWLRRDMILFSAKKSAVHDMHLDAVEAYATQSGVSVSGRIHGLGALWGLLTSRDRVMFSQSTGVASLIVLPLARINGVTIIHYMHEPTSLRLKLRENPPVKSVIWHAVQWLEVRCATRVLVSRQALLEQAADVYAVPPSKVSVAPLLMPEIAPPDAPTAKARVTYLGRIDARRYFQEFLAAAPALKARGYIPTILTGDVDGVKKHAPQVPDDIELFAEPNFSEALKARVLGETLALWNPKRGNIAQSGVTADAVRYGVAVLLTDKDPSYETLRAGGIALDFPTAADCAFQCLDDVDAASVTARAAQVFSAEHGRDAFEKTYLSLLP